MKRLKKIISFIAVLSALTLIFTTFAFADTAKDVPQWFKDMLTWKQAQIDQAVEDGTITQDQAASYKSRLDEMEKWHEQNGFGPGMTGKGGCGFTGSEGRSSSFQSGMMNGQSFGPEMMGSYIQ